MQQEPLTFCELMTQIPSIDSQDRAKSLDKTIETEYKILMRKISEYGQKGELNIKVVFTPQKDTKSGLTIEATVTAKAPKGKPKVNFYRGQDGVYLGEPSNLSLFKKEEIIDFKSKQANDN